MIDYLERLFAPERFLQEEKPEPEFRFSSLGEEAGEEMVSPVFQPEEAEELVKTREIAQFWQAEESRWVDYAPEAVSVPPSRPDITRPGEPVRVRMAGEESAPEQRNEVSVFRPREEAGQVELERRLRRESRRYDSGFFWF